MQEQQIFINIDYSFENKNFENIKQSLRCCQNQKSILICISSQCKYSGLICQNIQCKCNQKHTKCSLIQISNFISIIQSHKQQDSKEIKSYYQSIYNKINNFIDQLSKLRQKFQFQEKYYGLRKNQIELIQIINQNKLQKINGKLINQIYTNFDKQYILIQPDQNIIQKVFYEKNKQFQKLIKSFDKLYFHRQNLNQIKDIYRLKDIALKQQKNKNYKRAIVIYQRCLVLHNKQQQQPLSQQQRFQQQMSFYIHTKNYLHGDTLYQLGLCYNYSGISNQQALNYLDQSICYLYGGRSHKYRSSKYQCIVLIAKGKIYEQYKQFQQAEKVYLQSIQIAQKRYGDYYESCLNTWLHLANLYFYSGLKQNYNKAFQYYEKIITGGKKNYQKNYIVYLLQAYANSGLIYCEYCDYDQNIKNKNSNNKQKAKKLFSEAINLGLNKNAQNQNQSMMMKKQKLFYARSCLKLVQITMKDQKQYLQTQYNLLLKMEKGLELIKGSIFSQKQKQNQKYNKQLRQRLQELSQLKKLYQERQK